MKYNDPNFLKMLGKHKVINDAIGKEIKLAMVDALNLSAAENHRTKLLD